MHAEQLGGLFFFLRLQIDGKTILREMRRKKMKPFIRAQDIFIGLVDGKSQLAVEILKKHPVAAIVFVNRLRTVHPRALYRSTPVLQRVHRAPEAS